MQDVSKIRNIVILGHQGSGKTTLVESLLHVLDGGEKGSVERKNTVSDYLPIEMSRGSSTRLSVQFINYNGYKLNFIDVPGNDDFVSEALSAIKVVKGAILVIDAVNGIEIETLKHWRFLRKRNIPTIIYINKMDKENVNFEFLLSDIREKLGKNAIPFCYPMGHNDGFDGFVNIVTLKARKYNGKTCEDAPIYEDKKMKVFELHNTMVESVAGSSEELLDKFFNGEELTNEEINKGLRNGVLNGELIPVLVGSALKNIGIHTMLDMLISYLPNPSDLKPIVGLDENGNEVVCRTSLDDEFSAFVFKTYVDPYFGTTSIIKVNSGKISVGDDVYIPSLKKNVNISNLAYLQGGKQINTNTIGAGDIGVINKLEGLETNMSLCSLKRIIMFKPIEYPSAVYFKALVPKTKNDSDKLSSVLNKLKLENPNIVIKRNIETKQLLLGTTSYGELMYLVEIMKNNYKLSIDLEDVKIVYKETIKKSAKGIGRYIKQSGGSGFYGVVEMEFSPNEKNEFVENIFGGAVPKNYFPAVEKGFFEACEKGELKEFPVVGVKANLIDGKYHSVDSNELAFKMAAILAFKDAYMKCEPTILEPIYKITVTAKPSDIGNILSNLNQKRAKILDIVINKTGEQKIIALAPEAEILEYANDLKSITQGNGYFNREFYDYQEVPKNILEALLK